MNRELKQNLFNIVFGMLLLFGGLLTIKAKGFSTGVAGHWITLNKEAALFLGGLLICYGVYCVQRGVRKFIKSRRK